MINNKQLETLWNTLGTLRNTLGNLQKSYRAQCTGQTDRVTFALLMLLSEPGHQTKTQKKISVIMSWAHGKTRWISRAPFGHLKIITLTR